MENKKGPIINLFHFKCLSIIRSLIVILCINGCFSENTKVIERHEDGTPKIIMTDLDKSSKVYKLAHYGKYGSLKYESWLKNDKLDGDFIVYYESGGIKAVQGYKNNLLDGDSKEYDEKGNLIAHFLYSKGEKVYEKTYSESGSLLSLFYSPIIKIDTSGLKLDKSRLKFEVDFPVTDSLVKDRQFVFAYQMKPMALKDSIIVFPKYEKEISNKSTLRCTIDIINNKDRLFYGHLLDKKNMEIFNPYEKEILIKD